MVVYMKSTKASPSHQDKPMNGKNQPLVTDEPVEFEK